MKYVTGPLVALVFLFQTVQAHAKELSLTLVTEHMPPFQIVNEDSSISGFSTDIVKEVMRRSGYTYDLKAFVWARSYNLTLNTPNLCIYSMARLPFREKLFKWVAPITKDNYPSVWEAKRHKGIQVRQLEDLRNFLTVVVRNDFTHQVLLDMGFEEGKNLYVVDRVKSLLKMLVSRSDVDFIIADHITISDRAKLVGIDPMKLRRVYEIKEVPIDYYFACHIDTDPMVINKLSLIFQQIHQDGFYDKLIEQWGVNVSL